VDDRARGSGWKAPVLFLGTAVFLVLAGGGIHFGLDSALERHRRECTAIRNTFPEDTSPRPAILDPEEGGNVWELLIPAVVRIDDLDPNIDNFDAHGIPGQTPRLIELAGPDLEFCRLAARRRDRSWSGPRLAETVSPRKAILALSSKALLLWRNGRDAEAAEWIVTALTVATDFSALTGDIGYQGDAATLVNQDLRDLLSEHSLTAAQLEDLGRRLNLLHSLQLPFNHHIRRSFAEFQLEVLEQDPWIGDDGSGKSGELSTLIGWKDCFSVRVAKVRLLCDLRSCRRELERVTWRTPSSITEASRIVDTYRNPYVRSLLSSRYGFKSWQSELGDLGIPDVMIQCARFQAERGRLPRTWEEAGITLPVAPWLALEEGRIVLTESGIMNPFIIDRFPDEWILARRK